MFKLKFKSNTVISDTKGLKVFKLHHKTSASIGKIITNKIEEEPIITQKSIKELYISDNFYTKDSILELQISSFYTYINSIDINGIKYNVVLTETELVPQTYYYDLFNQKINIKLATDVYINQAILLYGKSSIY